MGREAHVRRERWERIKDIFDQALARDEAERDRFLVEASGDDGELLAELRSTSRGVRREFSRAFPGARKRCAGKKPRLRLSSWELAWGTTSSPKRIARGGMGEIYRAVHVGTGQGHRL